MADKVQRGRQLHICALDMPVMSNIFYRKTMFASCNVELEPEISHKSTIQTLFEGTGDKGLKSNKAV